MDYLFHLLAVTCIYGTLAVALNLVVGYTGLLSLAQAAFYGLGAYSSALASVHLGLSFFPAVLIGAVTAGILSLLVSLPAARLRDDYFTIATFGFQYIVWHVVNNWTAVTRGPMGIGNIPRPSVLGVKMTTPPSFLLLATGMLLVAYLVSIRIVRSPYGRILMAIREDEDLLEMLGKSPLRFKVSVMAVSAGLAGVAGAAYGHYFTYVSPTSFTVMESILILAMVIVGGSGSLAGPLVGAMLLVALPEALRFFGIPTATAATLRQVIYGAALVSLALYRPRGLLGQFEFGR
jgi:branched-chain amino acid transport system permease protein